MAYSNPTGLGMILSAWLMADGYDHNPAGAPNGEIVSATTLLKPTRSLILGRQVTGVASDKPIHKETAARSGQAIHQGIEDAFRDEKVRNANLKALGFPSKTVDNIVINPTAAQLAADPGIFPVYLEQRSYKEVIIPGANAKIWISGKYDQVVNGEVGDIKKTSVYKYGKLAQTDESEYSKQQSIYRWLNPDIITSDIGSLSFVILDWKQSEINRFPNYPPEPAVEVDIPLMSLEDTEAFVLRKLSEIYKNSSLPQSQMIRCTDEELWRTPPKHKYYAEVENARKIGGRSTKNFDNLAQAMAHKAKASKGTVVSVGGEVRRCLYCDAAPTCQQRLEYFDH